MGQHAVSRSRSVRRILVGAPLLTAIYGLAASSAAAPVMERVAVEPGIELEYSVHGQGEPGPAGPDTQEALNRLVRVHEGILARVRRELFTSQPLNAILHDEVSKLRAEVQRIGHEASPDGPVSLDLRSRFPYTSEGLPGSRARALWTGGTFSRSSPLG